MIVDKTVLEADSRPQEILHRHEQINYLSDILEPVADGDRVDGALIYGLTGTGKTAPPGFCVTASSRNRPPSKLPTSIAGRTRIGRRSSIGCSRDQPVDSRPPPANALR